MNKIKTCPCCEGKWEVEIYLSKWDLVYFDRLKWMNYQQLCDKYNLKSKGSITQYIRSREKKYWKIWKISVKNTK